jgi:Na+-driven multidrug efflux pump
MKALAAAAEFLATAIGSLIVSAVVSLLGGWMFMLAVGVAHHEWLPGLPTVGYWWAVLITWLIRSAALTAPSSDGDR